jgi:hypothetical protein
VVSTSTATQLGFMTILHEATGYLGGYLVTNLWGRPLEFRLSTAVQPNRVQQILYGQTLVNYVHGDVIGKALVEKTSVAAGLIFTDRASALQLRQHIESPVIWIAQGESEPEQFGIIARPATDRRPPLVIPQRFGDDLPRVQETIDQIDGGFDLLEPFNRVREAIAEARKLGVTSRG